jgi:hypothetical protein
MLVTGCSSGDDGSSPGSVASTVSGSTAVGTTSPAVSVVQTATLPPVSLPSEGMAGAIEILGGPDWLAADDLGVWVKLDSGAVALVDPVTHAVVDTVEPDPGGALCQGLGAGAGSIWSCVSSGVARIDPATRGGISIIASNKTATQGELPIADQQLWVLIGDGTILEGIRTSEQAVWSRFSLPVRGTDIDAGAAGLWVVSSVDDAVLQIDMNTGKVLTRVSVQAPVDVAVDSEVWVGAAAETVRIDPATATIDRSVAAGTGADGAIALTPGEVWIRNVDPFLTRADRATGAIVQQYANADVTGAGDILYAFGSIWTTASEVATLFRFAAPA